MNNNEPNNNDFSQTLANMQNNNNPVQPGPIESLDSTPVEQLSPNIEPLEINTNPDPEMLNQYPNQIPTPVTQEPVNPPMQGAVEPKPKKSGSVIGIILGVVLFIIIIVMVILLKGLFISKY